jgi:hypothetical protein
MEKAHNMKFLRHMSENLFITVTGIAALVHSTWSLGTMFSGEAPQGDWIAFAGWVLPAFFVAFAMDIGQISTSAVIRHNGLTWQRALTFFVFALATWYLQFLYIAHHLPVLALSAGISEAHRETVKISVDAAIWILPMLLPLATMLYTISDSDSKEQTEAHEHELLIEKPKNEPQLLIEENFSEFAGSKMLAEERIQEPKYKAECHICGWHKEYETEKSSQRALRTHESLHCPNRFENQESEERGFEKAAQNGHVD